MEDVFLGVWIMKFGVCFWKYRRLLRFSLFYGSKERNHFLAKNFFYFFSQKKCIN